MNKLQKIIAVVLLSFVFIFSLLLFALSTPTAFAQSVGCAVTKVGNPQGPIPSFPPGCTFTNGATGWPLETRSPSQYGRVDQGWDLWAHSVANILAVAPGVVHMHVCNSNCGFGPDLPVLVLDTPISYNGETYKYIYYGHTHTDRSVNGKHVNTGDVIAHTDGMAIGSSSPNQFEIGFLLGYQPPPVDYPIWDKLHLRDPDHPGDIDWTPTGQNMCTWLSGLSCADSGPSKK